jgi:ParB-like chromosome segregation protein Spo0J
LDGEPVQVEVTAIAPEAPISAIPPQQTPITAPQPAEAIKDTPVIEMVDLAKIKTSELFEQLFSRRPEVVEQLAKDMLEHGFDPAHPLCLWGETLTDGNQRLTAAQKAGITRVPVVRHQFASELDAIEYAIAANSHRRDKLSESEKVHLVQVLDQRQPRGGDHKSAAAKSKAAPAAFEKSSQRTGRLIGISASQVERIRRVLDTGGEDIKAQVRNGTLTLSQAAAKVRARKKPLVLHEPTARRKAYTKASSTLTTVATNLRPFDAKLADRVDKLAVVMDGKAEAIGKKPEQIKPADKILELDSIGQIRKFKNAARISKLKNGVRVAAGNSDAQDQGSK